MKLQISLIAILFFKTVNAGEIYWLGDKTTRRVETLVKLFDATYPAVEFCEPTPAYIDYMDLLSTEESKENSVRAKLKSSTSSSSSPFVASAHTAMPLYDRLPFTPITPLPRLIEDMVVETIMREITLASRSAILSNHTTSEEKEMYRKVLKKVIPSYTSASRMKRKSGSSLKSVPEPEFEPTPMLDLLASQTMAKLADCIVKDSKWDSRLGIPSSVQIFSSERNLGQCMCEAVEWGYVNGDHASDPCTILNVLEQALCCGGNENVDCTNVLPEVQPPAFAQCTPPAGVSGTTSTDPNVDFDLFLHPRKDLAEPGEPMPAFIPEAIRDAEGLTYYYLYRANIWGATYAVDVLCGVHDIEIVPGWKTALYIDTRQEGDKKIKSSGKNSVNFAVVSRRGCDTLITIRGTSTSFEWRLDFTYNQIFAALKNSPTQTAPAGQHHHGFSALISSFLPSLDVYFNDLFSECSPDDKPRVIVTGHSLGGGVASVLAHLLALKVEGRAEVSAVLFAPPQALSPEAADQFDRLVNTRSLKGSHDPIADMPCTQKRTPSGMMLCDLGNVRNGPSHTRVHYNDVKGVIIVKADELESISGDTRWTSNNLADINLNISPTELQLEGRVMDAANMNMMAFHVCSYGCWTGKFCVDPSTEKWMCSDDATTNVERCSFMGFDLDITIPLI